jgi:hypothetical protein
MKNSVLKMMVLPVAAFALASAGAVSSQSKSGTGLAAINGYVHQSSPTACNVRSVDCNPNSGQICTSVENLQVYRYDDLGTACDQFLYKN